MMRGREKSDRRVVPRRPANNAERSATEGGGGKASAQGKRQPAQHTPDTVPDVVCHKRRVGRMAELDGSPGPKAAMFSPKRGARCGVR